MDIFKVKIIEMEYYGMIKICKKLRFLKILKRDDIEKYDYIKV
jgi:hypothetical protein